MTKSAHDVSIHSDRDGRILQFVPKTKMPDITKVRFTPRMLGALLLQSIALQRAPTAPITGERNDFIGARKVTPPEVDRDWDDIVDELNETASTGRPASRGFELGTISYTPTQISPDAACSPVTLATFAGAMDQLVPALGQLRRAAGDLHDRLDLVEEQVSVDGSAPRIAALEARAAQAEARAAEMERRATAAEALVTKQADALERLATRVDAIEEANRGRDSRLDNIVERALDIEDRMVEDIGLSVAERKITLTAKRRLGDISCVARLDYQVDRGIYQSGRAYEKADLVTFAGSGFVAQRDVGPTEKPGSSTAWRLFVKRGRDGAPAK